MFGIDDAAIAGLAPAVGGVLGKLFGSKDKKKAQEAAQQAYDLINQVGAPPELQKQILLDTFKSAGLYSPQLEQEINQTVSKVSQIQEDPRLKDAQMQALGSLQKSGRTGLTATDRAALNQVRQENARDTEAKRQQIIQNMQARGQGGSGAELAAQLQAAQGGADSASASGDRIAAMAQENALGAISKAGTLGGQIRSQDLDVNKLKASAEDEMNRFNIQNAINRQQRNVGSTNQASQENLANQQAILNANTQQQNQELLRQKAASQQDWQNQMAAAQARAQARLGQSNIYAGKAADTAATFQGVGSGLGAAAGANAVRTQQQKNFNQLSSLLGGNQPTVEGSYDDFYKNKLDPNKEFGG